MTLERLALNNRISLGYGLTRTAPLVFWRPITGIAVPDLRPPSART